MENQKAFKPAGSRILDTMSLAADAMTAFKSNGAVPIPHPEMGSHTEPPYTVDLQSRHDFP